MSITTLLLILQCGCWLVHAEILVVGSINADTFLPVKHLPREGENLTLRPGCQPTVDVPGGKGCTQAVAASKLSDTPVRFVGQLGCDAAATTILQSALVDANVDVSLCGHHSNLPSGRGYVFLAENGSVSAVVSGGSNEGGWVEWENCWKNKNSDGDATTRPEEMRLQEKMQEMLLGMNCLMLQREVPEYVNIMIAREARRRGVLVVQDLGGEDRPITKEMLMLCDFIIPNESEITRLLRWLDEEPPNSGRQQQPSDSSTDTPDSDVLVVAQARRLQEMGARNVLVTRGSRGATLVTEGGQVLHQEACMLPDGASVVDETGAGDCFRAAFCVSLLEGFPLQESLEFASAAGACAVTVAGAVPSAPTRKSVEALLLAQRRRGQQHQESHHEASSLSSSSSTEDVIHDIPRGGGIDEEGDENDMFPFMFGSRLNSMKDRPELWNGPLSNARDFLKRQATIRGLTCVDFNYPQHFEGCWSSQEAKAALDEVGLVAGAVCLRYPSKFARGAMNHPDAELRREAIELTKEAAATARVLGCNEVVVWSAYDGYDYPFQVDYDEKWDQLVQAFQECCDSYPDIKFSIEYKPTDEHTRFFTVPSTGAALLLVKDIDRPNMGLTLDCGHMLMSGENPAQSISMAGKHLFGVQLNDGYTRLAAEDGMMFGSIHPSMALEAMYQLKRIGFSGHFYFDTFPQRTDPVKEAEWNIRRVKQFWKAVTNIDEQAVRRAATNLDAIEALAIVDTALKSL